MNSSGSEKDNQVLDSNNTGSELQQQDGADGLPSDEAEGLSRAVSRRGFLSTLGMAFMGALGAKMPSLGSGSASNGDGAGWGLIDDAEAQTTGSTPRTAFAARKTFITSVRNALLSDNLRRSFPSNPNDFSKDVAPYTSNFTKGLPHNEFGEVDPAAYRQLLTALRSGRPTDFERITLGGSKRLKNPLAAYAVSFDTLDAYQYRFSKAPPAVNSQQMAAEVAELYWMALSRDTNFIDYGGSALTSAAAGDLSQFAQGAQPKSNGAVTTDLLYRINLQDGSTGPMISQLLYADIPLGNKVINHKFRTVIANTDYLTSFDAWKSTQDGMLIGNDAFDSTERYVRNGRDLAEVFHNDRFPNIFEQLGFILQFGYGIPFSGGHPYNRYSKTTGFATFDYFHLQCLLAEVAKRAMWTEFVRKWQVWRRLRPEAYGGLVHNKIVNSRDTNIALDILLTGALDRTFSKYGSYLLPQAYPEGSPGHPSYGSGHSVAAGACATILKMWFDEEATIPSPKVASADGLSLVNYTGADAGSLTVRSEVNKYAYNVAQGRMFGGIHYRSDCEEGLLLGEQVAITYMENQRRAFSEKFDFTFTRFNGTTKTIRN